MVVVVVVVAEVFAFEAASHTICFEIPLSGGQVKDCIQYYSLHLL